MTMRDFVRRAEKQSKQSIRDCYNSIDFLYYELDLLNEMLTRYKRKGAGTTLTYSEKREFIEDIHDRIPDIYTDENMVFCKWDYSDLNLKITEILTNFKELQGYYVENMRNSFATEYNSEKMVLYIYDIIKNIPGYC